MKEYVRLTKAALIERLKALEEMAVANELQQIQRSTERKQTQAALRDSESRLRAILDTAVEGIITIDEHGSIESFNPAAERIFGYSSEEIIGQNVSHLMPAPYRQEHDAYIANYLRTGRAKIIGIGREVVGRRKDGTIFPMDLAVSEVRLADRRLFTGFVRDITERKRLEQEILEISGHEQRRIGQDLHDGLCQQLAGIELLSQVLEQKLEVKSPTEAARAAEIARHVRQAITHTRNLARGLSPVELEANGLSSALLELASNVEKLFKVDCGFQGDESVLVPNNSVATHVYRIAQEAINNAIKHGKARNILITLKPVDGNICLTVADDGIGFSKESTQSTGMGLQIMNYRAGMIGASLEIRRANGRGTTVTCSFRQPL
ncbi:MAG: PAS domain S-box protein [Verrucomicrobia bacterium]|nr:PAS domain S-box protein [Verrucomicrobiota bacterium]